MIYLSVKLVEGNDIHDHRNRYELFFKEVEWSCIPVPKNHDMRVTLGKDENGEETGWSIMPYAVWFESTGDICIELQNGLHPEVDPFDKFVQYLKNDGFSTYDEWKEKENT